jgi:hypothetical protein
MCSRSCVSLVVLATLVLSQALFAAPKPNPPGFIDPKNLEALREAKEQQMRFQAAGLSIPAVPSNGGLCVIDTSGHFGALTGQPGMSDTYRLYEIQRWMVSPTPMQPGQIPLTYAVNWDSVGNGFRHADDGAGTVDDWKFAIGAASTTTLTARKNLGGGWLIQMAQASMPNGVAVTQQQTLHGQAYPPGTRTNTDVAVGFLGVTFSPQPGSQPNTPVTGSQVVSWQVPQQLGWGYPMPGYATGKISCFWNLSVGP